MRLSQILVAVAASFLFASEAIAVTMDSNQAKISTVARGGPNQRLLRRYKKPVEENFDDLDDLDDSEERGGNSALKELARSWSMSYDDIVNNVVRLSDDQYVAWQAILNKGIDAAKKTKRDAYNKAWRKAHGIGTGE